MMINSLLFIANNYLFVALFNYFYCANLDFEKSRCLFDDVMRFIFSQFAVDIKNLRNIKNFLCSEYKRQIVKAYNNKLNLSKLKTQNCIQLIL